MRGCHHGSAIVLAFHYGKVELGGVTIPIFLTLTPKVKTWKKEEDERRMSYLRTILCAWRKGRKVIPRVLLYFLEISASYIICLEY
jgi:hypothetical protein